MCPDRCHIHTVTSTKHSSNIPQQVWLEPYRNARPTGSQCCSVRERPMDIYSDWESVHWIENSIRTRPDIHWKLPDVEEQEQDVVYGTRKQRTG